MATKIMMGTIEHVHNVITSLFFTIIIETSVLFLIVSYILKYQHLNKVKIIFIGILASATTLPYVAFVFPRLMDWPKSQWLIVAEIFAVIVEAILYRFLLKLDWKIAFGISLVCNIASYYLGYFLHSNGIWFYW